MNKLNMIDVSIIGAGPAGLSAAINAAARNKSVVVFGNKQDSTSLFKAEKVNNHLGMPDMTGEEMSDAFYRHALASGVEIREGRMRQILPTGAGFALNFGDDFIETKTVVIATGISKKSRVKGESEFLGKGVSYCATCDGMLYRGKKVVVVGDTDEARDDANFLSEICGEVTFVPLNETPTGLADNIHVVKAAKPLLIKGGDFVSSIVVGKEELPCDGVFIITSATPVESLIYGLKTKNGVIKTNRQNETNIPGVFACGDCAGPPFQISKAVGEGLIAALTACKYIDRIEKND